MAKYFRSIQAGRYRCDYTYSRVSRYDSDKARAEKKRASSAAQKLVNDKLSRIQLTGILAETFIDYSDSYFVSLTLDELHYPVTPRKSEIRAVMERHAPNYIERLRYQAKKRGVEVYSVWWLGIGEEGRYHIHCVLRGPSWEDIRDCWQLGNVDFHNLYADHEWAAGRDWWSPATNRANPVQIAKYAMQNANERPVGKHPWHASRNCKRPKAQPARIVPDAASIDPPDGAELLDKIDHSTVYGAYTVVEYILPASATEVCPAAAGSGKTRKNRQLRQ